MAESQTRRGLLGGAPVCTAAERDRGRAGRRAELGPAWALVQKALLVQVAVCEAGHVGLPGQKCGEWEGAGLVGRAMCR